MSGGPRRVPVGTVVVALGSALLGAGIAVAVVSASSETVAGASALAPSPSAVPGPERGGGDPEPQPAATGEAAPASVRALDVDADAYAFLRDLLAAREGDPATLGRRYSDVRVRWTHARVRWEVLVVEALCRRPDACFVHAYDRERAGGDAIQGFMPKIVFTPAEHARLLQGCAGQAPCVATIEATMRDVVVREDRPTRLTLADARVHSTRAARPTEHWFAAAR